MTIISFNSIQNHIIQYHSKSNLLSHSKSYYSIKFKIISLNEIQNLVIQNHIIHTTVLHLAAQKENFSIIKLLIIKKGIDINIKDSQGKRPIEYSENFEIKQLLSKEFQ